MVWWPFFKFSLIYWDVHHPNWRTRIFQVGVALAHQPDYIFANLSILSVFHRHFAVPMTDPYVWNIWFAINHQYIPFMLASIYHTYGSVMGMVKVHDQNPVAFLRRVSPLGRCGSCEISRRKNWRNATWMWILGFERFFRGMVFTTI